LEWQRERGETDGRKERPVCVVIAVRGRDDLTHLALLAISSQPPGGARFRTSNVVAPASAIGGAPGSRSANTIATSPSGHGLDLNQPPLGRFSKPFMIRLASAFAPQFKKQARVDRSE